MDFTFSLSTFENRSILSSYSLLHSQVGSGDAGSAGSHTGNSFQRSIELSLAPKYAFGLYTHLEYFIHLKPTGNQKEKIPPIKIIKILSEIYGGGLFAAETLPVVFTTTSDVYIHRRDSIN